MGVKGERTRQRILNRAATLFNQHGYAGTPLTEVLGATGLKKGGLYRHFGSKDELALAAFRVAWEKARRPREEGLATCRGAANRLRGMVRSFVHIVPDDLPGGCPLMNTAVDADDTNPKLLALVREALGGWRRSIEKTVRAGQRAGELERTMPAAEVSRILIGALEGAVLVGRIEGDRRALRITQRHLEGFIGSLEVRPAKKIRRVRDSRG
jgi:TetR/AcrR family transcriptional repressor of nem operon